MDGTTFNDPDIARLIALTDVAECDQCNASFPQDRLGRTVIETRDGRRLDSGLVRAPGEHTNPIDRAGIVSKYRDFVAPVLDDGRVRQIEDMIFGLDQPDRLSSDFCELVYPPASRSQGI